jgi:hypothetical protein
LFCVVSRYFARRCFLISNCEQTNKIKLHYILILCSCDMNFVRMAKCSCHQIWLSYWYFYSERIMFSNYKTISAHANGCPRSLCPWMLDIIIFGYYIFKFKNMKKSLSITFLSLSIIRKTNQEQFSCISCNICIYLYSSILTSIPCFTDDHLFQWTCLSWHIWWDKNDNNVTSAWRNELHSSN